MHHAICRCVLRARVTRAGSPQGQDWSSCEQCFQAMKFGEASDQCRAIAACRPDAAAGETSRVYGMRVWQLGQSRESPLKPRFEDVKVVDMYKINLAKYLSGGEAMRAELLAASCSADLSVRYALMGPASTWEWQKWNGGIQTRIRDLLADGADLAQELERVSASDSDEAVAAVMTQLEACCPEEDEGANGDE